MLVLFFLKKLLSCSRNARCYMRRWNRRTFSLMVSDADVCLRKMLAIPTLKDRSSGTCLVISDVIRWQPLDGAVTVMVRCAHPAVPVTICIVGMGRRWWGALRHVETNVLRKATSRQRPGVPPW